MNSADCIEVVSILTLGPGYYLRVLMSFWLAHITTSILRPFLTVEVDVDDLRLHLKKHEISHPYKKQFGRRRRSSGSEKKMGDRRISSASIFFIADADDLRLHEKITL